MRSVLLVCAHELRTRWQAWVSLALLVAFAGGCVLAAAAGARRTGSAYQRFLVASKASDVLVSPAGTGLRGYYAALARLPSAAAAAPVAGLNVLPMAAAAGAAPVPAAALQPGPAHRRASGRPGPPPTMITSASSAAAPRAALGRRTSRLPSAS